MKLVSIGDFPVLNFGDKRRDERFVKIINNVVSRPSSSIPQQTGNWYETKATYNFFKSKSVKLKSIEEAVQSYGGSQLAGLKKVLVAHDFCQVSFNGLDATEGLGYLANSSSLGIITYNSIAVSTEGVPLSLLYQHTFTRALENLGKAENRHGTTFEDKESYHWYKGMAAASKSLGSEVQAVHIADREADIYELFAAAEPGHSDLLIRSTHNRRLKSSGAEGSEEAGCLWDKLSGSPVAAEVALKIPEARSTKRVEITASVQFEKVVVQKPSSSKSKQESVGLTAILLRQVSPKEDWQEDPVEWKLLTSLRVESVADALQCVLWYCYRWLIERFHYVLKSGTGVEDLQLEKATSLQKALHLYSMAAMEIMKLAYLSRAMPAASCELVLTKEQWAVLYMLTFKTAVLPETPPTMEEATKWIGKLGGHLGRTADGPPGVKVIWRGYRKLIDAVEMYAILTKEKFG
ncbi:IS4 family transposase [Parasediminibacterium sp. JCM 36343]|uniref:IS4 family transposase n=1 Tax=Parasediminibacterium sp. JCM 36343 TaxID=3374279 RepID=UPI00397B7341